LFHVFISSFGLASMAVRAATFRESSGGSKSVLINQIAYLEASSFQLLPDDTVPAQGAYGSAGAAAVTPAEASHLNL
jgi:hypothetical protein